MTPARPVTIDKRDSASKSNGYGTLAEAGRTTPEALADLSCTQHGALAITRIGNAVAIITRSAPGAQLQLVVGKSDLDKDDGAQQK